MELYTKYLRPDKKKFMEYCGGDKITESAGYVKPTVMIHRMIEMGEERKLRHIEQLYDMQEGEPVDWSKEDPTRDPKFDMADGSEILRGLEEERRRNDENGRREEESKTKHDKDTEEPRKGSGDDKSPEESDPAPAPEDSEDDRS